MTYEELFRELFTMRNDEDFENFTHHLLDSWLITQTEYEDLWEMACDIHQRFVK